MIWSLGLLAAGFFVNSYSTSNGPGETLVQVNGLKVLIPLGIPLIGAALVAFVLWRRRHFQIPGVGVVVWVVFGLLAVGAGLGALTIGPFIAPVAVFLLVAITRIKGQSTIESANPSPVPT
jgi:hypothetical protein